MTNRPLALAPGASALLLAMQQLHRLLGWLDAALQRRARQVAAVCEAAPWTALDLWTGALQAARAHRHGQRD